MLPPGHIAAGYLTADLLIKIGKPNLPANELRALPWIGAAFGFAPDLDMFVAFAQAHGFTIPGTQINHRRFPTHRPFLWFCAGIIIYAAAAVFGRSQTQNANAATLAEFWKYIGLIVWIAPWSHFALDSIKGGVKWLWPFRKNFYALKEPGVKEEISGKRFFGYWKNFLHHYAEKAMPVLILEIILLAVWIIVLI